VWNFPHIQYILNTFTFRIPFASLNHKILKVPPIVPSPTSEEVVFNFNWASSAGTAIFISLLLATPLLKISFCEWKKQAIDSLKQLKWTWFTMATVNGIAFLMNYSGMAVTLGLALAKTGSLFPFLSPAIAWLGTFLVGSNTISNAMFGNLQVATARTMGLSPVLFAATNGSGAVAGKMIAPNQLTAAASSVELPGHEGELFKLVFKHSILFVIMVGFITWIESFLFAFIIP
jgi:lactate permease